MTECQQNIFSGKSVTNYQPIIIQTVMSKNDNNNYVLECQYRPHTGPPYQYLDPDFMTQITNVMLHIRVVFSCDK